MRKTDFPALIISTLTLAIAIYTIRLFLPHLNIKLNTLASNTKNLATKLEHNNTLPPLRKNIASSNHHPLADSNNKPYNEVAERITLLEVMTNRNSEILDAFNRHFVEISSWLGRVEFASRDSGLLGNLHAAGDDVKGEDEVGIYRGDLREGGNM